MALGRQFENTYWEDPETGGTHVWARKGNSPLYGYYSTHEGEHIPITELSDNSSSLQGLLFHPLTGTGLKGDPMVPEATRKEVIKKALDLTDVKRYKQNLSGILGTITQRSGNNRIDRYSVERSNISDRTAEKHIEWITNTLNDSDMPTHVIEQRTGIQTNLDPKSVKRPIRTVLDPMPGRAWAEANGSAIRLTMPNKKRTKTVTTAEMVNVPSTTPIGNPKFWEHLTKARRRVSGSDEHNVISSDDAFRLATHWVNPTTGHVMTKEFAENLPIDHSAEPIGEAIENTMETPALVLKSMGYVPNLFPGKGTPTAKSHSVGNHGKIETGYGDLDRGREYTYSTFHTRFTPGTQEQRIVTKGVRVDPVLSEKTMTHELGHALDTSMENTYTNRGNYVVGKSKRNPWSSRAGDTVARTAAADPVEEGIADASADRYTRYKGKYSDALTNLETRARDFESTGYSIGYSGWKNAGQRALYVASRYHAALSDDNPQPIISRDALYKMLPRSERDFVKSRGVNNESLDIMNNLALGHMYHHMPHIHGILRQTGLEDAAKAAHEEYKKRMRLTPPEQPTLPGMEKFV